MMLKLLIMTFKSNKNVENHYNDFVYWKKTKLIENKFNQLLS